MTVTTKSVLEEVLAEQGLFGQEGACPTLFEDGSLDRVLVISGENAGGKSFLCRVLGHYGKKRNKDLEVMHLGMSLRAEGGWRRAMVWGDEIDESTGRNSMKVALHAVDRAHERERDHWLILDEPDIGLGEGYANALGIRFAHFAARLPDITNGFIVVSHSRALVRPLIEAGAMSVRVGNDIRPVREWIEVGDRQKSVEDLEGLVERSRERNSAIHRAMNEIKARKDSESRQSFAPGLRGR